MRRAILAVVVTALLLAGCSHAAQPGGVVDGHFRVPGGSPGEIQRGGLNFASASGHKHGHGHGVTVRVGANGEYTVALPPGSYSVIGALSGQSGGPAPEACAATIRVVVKARRTTRADYVCRATPVTAPAP